MITETGIDFGKADTMETSRLAYTSEQLEPADHSFCWAEPCATCRRLKRVFWRVGLNERAAEFYQAMYMREPLKKSDFKVLHDATA